MAKNSSGKVNEEDDQKLLETIKKEIQSYYSTFGPNISEYHRAQAFVMDEDQQWAQEEKDYYEKHKRPRLSVNRLYLMIKQIVGAQRMATRNIQVRMIEGSPGSDLEDEVIEKRIELIENIVRTIAYNSNTDVVYQTGFKCSLFGIGAWKIRRDWADHMSFDQVAKIELSNDPTKHYYDLNGVEPLKQDGDFCGWSIQMHKTPFMQQYNISEDEIEAMLSQNNVADQATFVWATPAGNNEQEDMLTICHHFRKEYYTKTIACLSNNIEKISCDLDKVNDNLKTLNNKISMKNMAPNAQQTPPFVKIKERETKTYKIMEYIVCGTKIIKRQEWPSKYLPSPCIIGDSYIDKKGMEYVIPFTKMAEDAQKALNIATTNLADVLTRFRGERFKATPASIPKDAMDMWQNPWSYEGTFLYNATAELPQGPVPLLPSDVPQGLFVSIQTFGEMVNQLIGRSDTIQGEQGNEDSGVAIDARSRQSNETTFLNFDQLDRAIEYTGKVILDLIPKIYDTQRMMNVIGRDGKSKQVTVNNPQDPASMITEGRYEITIESGPSFILQQQEMAKKLMDLVQVDPQLMSIYGDVVVRNMDVNDAQELAKRAEIILDPRVLAMTGKKLPPMPTQPPSPQQQQAQLAMQEMQMKIQQSQQETQIKQQELQLKQVETEIKKAELQLKQQQMQLEALEGQQKNQLEAGKIQQQHVETMADILNTRVKARAEILKQAEANHAPLYQPKESKKGAKK